MGGKTFQKTRGKPNSNIRNKPFFEKNMVTMEYTVPPDTNVWFNSEICDLYIAN